MTTVANAYINAHSKSQAAGFLLTFFLGPLGLLYSSIVAGVILLVIAVAGFYTIIAPIACWVLSMILTFFFVSKHNEKVKTTAALQE